MSRGICPYCHGTGWNEAERNRQARQAMRDAYLKMRMWLIDQIRELEDPTDHPPAGSGGSQEVRDGS